MTDYTLKRDHRLLNPPGDSLSEKSKIRLNAVLAFSPLLRKDWKVAFSYCYEYSPNVQVAVTGFHRWLQQGDNMEHESVQSTLKTMRNLQNEIINYHHYRWTNERVESRHSRIKAY